MDEFELEQLRRSPKWAVVLNIYQRLQSEGRDQSPDFDGWSSRIVDVPEIPASELPSIHGKLIAYGFLKFDLAGRDGGIRYQLTPLAKLGINASAPADEDEPVLEMAGDGDGVYSRR
jgi:hypothetical protein